MKLRKNGKPCGYTFLPRVAAPKRCPKCSQPLKEFEVVRVEI
jgi:predicted Zn-ribbon and HTH transcriptional regulator